MQFRLLTSSSVAPFREKAEKTWGLKRYRWPRDMFRHCVFFGMYHIGDYFHYLRHLGPKSVFWCGHDIVNLLNNKIPWYKIFNDAEHYVENDLERDELGSLWLVSKVRPSFVEDIDDFPITFKPTDRPQVFLSTNVGREKEYGFELVKRLADKLPNITFHLYGGDRLYQWIPLRLRNIIFHGRVPNEKFNKEIKNYHCGLRPNEHDGNSEITMKSVLSGGYPITRIKYPHIWHYENENELVALLKKLKTMKEPNYEGRNYYRKILNNYPWIGFTLTEKNIAKVFRDAREALKKSEKMEKLIDEHQAFKERQILDRKED